MRNWKIKIFWLFSIENKDERIAKILDKQTESEWNLEGIVISGDFNGKQLKRIVYDPGFWFEWAAFHPDTELYGT